MPLARHLGVNAAIASRDKIDAEGCYTGEVDFYSAGEHKAAAILEEAKRYDLDLSGSFAYSDSVTDGPMPETVGHPLAVNPDGALLKEATGCGWELRVFENLRPLFEGQAIRAPKPMAIGALGATTLAGGLLWWKTRKPMGLPR